MMFRGGMIWLLFSVGQRYKGKFVCNGSETNIRECQMSYSPVTECDQGDLILSCDESMYELTF